jgi:uncharacterized repeat protein (TIGR01451 family)
VLTYTVTLKNNSQFSLNGTQVRLSLPGNGSFAGTTSDTTTVQGSEIVMTLGRLAAGTQTTVSIPVLMQGRGRNEAFAVVSSSTALPVFSNSVTINVR